MPSSILLVEDDSAIQETLVDALTDSGFEVQAASSIAQARAFMARGGRSFDIILLDAGLPDGDGRTLCASLRQQGCRAPILMLSGRSGEDDIVSGFEAGADDYLAKPFGLHELRARIAVQLRHTCSHAAGGVRAFDAAA